MICRGQIDRARECVESFIMPDTPGRDQSGPYALQNYVIAGILEIREKSTLSSPVPLFPCIFVIVELQVTQKFRLFLSFARPQHFLLQCHRTSDIRE